MGTGHTSTDQRRTGYTLRLLDTMVGLKQRNSRRQNDNVKLLHIYFAKVFVGCAIIGVPVLRGRSSLIQFGHGINLPPDVKLAKVCQYIIGNVEFCSHLGSNGKDSNFKQVMQVSHATGSDRYPDEYLAVKQFLQANSQTDNIKVLSFGSSYGNEAISLATLYFNEAGGFRHASIYGFDIDTDTIQQSRQYVADRPEKDLQIKFFDGRNTSLYVDGVYNAIFANSVLCDATSSPYNAAAVEAHFPFKDFDATLSSLDAVLIEGGVFAMINPSYEFSDSSLAENYEAIAQCEGNHVPTIDLHKHEFIMNDPKNRKDCVRRKTR